MNQLLLTLNKQKLPLLPIACILATIAVIALVVIPQIQQLKNASQELNQIQQSSNEVLLKIESLEDIKVPALEKDLQLLSISLPQSRDYLDGISPIQDLASSTNVTIQNVAFADNAELTQGISSYVIKLDVSAPLENIINFAKSINSSPRLMNITKAEITQALGNNYTAYLTINSYFAPLAPAPSSGVVSSELTQEEIDYLSMLAKSLLSTPGAKLKNVQTPGKIDPFN